MKKRLERILGWLRAQSPTVIKAAIGAIVPWLIKLGIASLAKAPKETDATKSLD